MSLTVIVLDYLEVCRNLIPLEYLEAELFVENFIAFKYRNIASRRHELYAGAVERSRGDVSVNSNLKGAGNRSHLGCKSGSNNRRHSLCRAGHSWKGRARNSGSALNCLQLLSSSGMCRRFLSLGVVVALLADLALGLEKRVRYIAEIGYLILEQRLGNGK